MKIILISIHAPPRGATRFPCGTFRHNRLISIHAPPRGATRARGKRVSGICISIHAPPRGATTAYLSVRNQFALFQFTPLREGRRGGTGYVKLRQSTFQFTPLREGRQSILLHGDIFKLFQFTPLREGRRAIDKKFLSVLRKFQFTPLREGRHHGALDLVNYYAISIHAPPRGATLFPPLRDVLQGHFNSRPSARGDQKNLRKILKRYYFNSRPSARGDAPASRFPRCRPHFNSRPSARGDRRYEGRKRGNIIFQFTPLREGRQVGRKFD